MRHINLKAVLPKNRNLSGWLYVEEDGALVFRIEVLGRGNKGPGDTQFLGDGNTPTGNFAGTDYVNTSSWNQDSYGPFGAIRLQPLSGNALMAHQLFGRDGLLIHGGSLGDKNYFRGAKQLRATKGCLRVRNDDMQKLVNFLMTDEKRQMSSAVLPEVTLSVLDN